MVAGRATSLPTFLLVAFFLPAVHGTAALKAEHELINSMAERLTREFEEIQEDMTNLEVLAGIPEDQVETAEAQLHISRPALLDFERKIPCEFREGETVNGEEAHAISPTTGAMQIFMGETKNSGFEAADCYDKSQCYVFSGKCKAGVMGRIGTFCKDYCRPCRKQPCEPPRRPARPTTTGTGRAGDPLPTLRPQHFQTANIRNPQSPPSVLDSAPYSIEKDGTVTSWQGYLNGVMANGVNEATLAEFRHTWDDGISVDNCYGYVLGNMDPTTGRVGIQDHSTPGGTPKEWKYVGKATTADPPAEVDVVVYWTAGEVGMGTQYPSTGPMDSTRVFPALVAAGMLHPSGFTLAPMPEYGAIEDRMEVREDGKGSRFTKAANPLWLKVAVVLVENGHISEIDCLQSLTYAHKKTGLDYTQYAHQDKEKTTFCREWLQLIQSGQKWAALDGFDMGQEDAKFVQKAADKSDNYGQSEDFYKEFPATSAGGKLHRISLRLGQVGHRWAHIARRLFVHQGHVTTRGGIAGQNEIKPHFLGKLNSGGSDAESPRSDEVPGVLLMHKALDLMGGYAEAHYFNTHSIRTA